MNNVKNTIGWADYTWNPVTGCYNGCSYCYAKKVWDRFFKEKYGCEFSEVIFHPDRLNEPLKKNNSTIFVGSMTDLLCYSNFMFTRVTETIRKCPTNLFMFLSKHVESYSGKVFPENTRMGITLESINNSRTISSARTMMSYDKSFVSIEPIMGTVNIDLNRFERVIVGAETGNRKGKVIPQKECIQSIKDHVPEEKIYWKKNILKYL